MPASPRRLSAFEVACLGVILAAGAWLRFAAIGAGIPFELGSDEPHVMERAVRILRTGDFNPHFFDYPGFYIYVQALAAAVRFLAGAMGGTWQSLDQVATTDFYLTGRAVTGLFGLATVAVVWRVGRRLDRLAGLAAALLLAVQPLHVRESQFVLTDVPMTFFVAVALLASVRAVERGTRVAWLVAGAAVGLAAGTKYTGGVAIVMPLVAVVLAPAAWRERARQAGAVVAGAAAAFLIAAPYTVLDPPGFLNGFAALAAAHAHGPVPDTPPWWIYLRHLQINLGWAGLVLALGSVVVSAPRAISTSSAVTRVIWAASAVVVLAFYVVVSRQTLVFARYLLPLLPALFVVAGGAAAMVWRRLASGTWLGWPVRAAIGAALVAVLAGPPALRAHGWVSERARVSTYAQAYDWIRGNVAPGSRLAIEATLGLPRDYPSVYVRRLSDETRESYDAQGVEYYVVAQHLSVGQQVSEALWRELPYRDVLRGTMLVAAFPPRRDVSGPLIRIYRRVPEA